MLAKEMSEHIIRVEKLVKGKEATEFKANSSLHICESWERCLVNYNIDPSTTTTPRILTAGELKAHVEPLEEFVYITKSGMLKLYERVAPAGFVVLLGNAEGVTIDYYGDPKDDAENRKAGLFLGSVWAESIEGTCGVGTCIEEKRPITIHRDEHFRARHIGLSCSTSPLFHPDGSLLGTLDISLLRPPKEKQTQFLSLQVVDYFARLIENAFFLRLFKDSWIIRFNTMRAFVEVVAESILAVNSDGQIVAANFSAQRELALNSKINLKYLSINEIFDLNVSEMVDHAMHKTTTILPLRSIKNGSQYFATFRAPENKVVLINNAKDASKVSLSTQQKASTSLSLEYLAGTDPQMLTNINCIKRVMNKDISMLLRGETGTGKEVFANAIHEASDRASKPFVALNCASIPESLIESELFGYKQGAFTGARSKGMRGKILQSDGGTLFLDEIGDMPLNLQTRLLRVLAEKEVLPLGSETPIKVDLHVICATLRNLEELVRQGEFREDLYYRLNGVTINLPSLRERKDKALIIENILALESDERTTVIDPEAFEMLMNASWPGNIRQLRNVLRFALAVCENDIITIVDLPPELSQESSTTLDTQAGGFLHLAEETNSNSIERAERLAIQNVLKKKKWNITLASMDLGISRATLYRKMKKYDIISPNEMEAIR